MTNLPEFLLYGENARLFPVVADTSREQRTLSIFLAVLTQVPAFARASLGSLGVRIGKRARISTFTEVTFKMRPRSNGISDLRGTTKLMPSSRFRMTLPPAPNIRRWPSLSSASSN